MLRVTCGLTWLMDILRRHYNVIQRHNPLINKRKKGVLCELAVNSYATTFTEKETVTHKNLVRFDEKIARILNYIVVENFHLF